MVGNMEIIILDTGKRSKDRGVISLVRCHCGKEFETEKRNITNNRISSCGCSRIKNIVGKIFGKIKVLKNTRKSGVGGAIWECQCLSCNKILELSTVAVTHPSRWSCGCDKSRIIASCKRKAGTNHHWYKHGLSDNNRDFRSCEESCSFRKLVFERDNYTCILCSKKGGELNAHHLDGYNWCVKRRTDISNGVTLCEKCHGKFHSIYGHGNNTEQQFLEFKKICL